MKAKKTDLNCALSMLTCSSVEGIDILFKAGERRLKRLGPWWIRIEQEEETYQQDVYKHSISLGWGFIPEQITERIVCKILSVEGELIQCSGVNKSGRCTVNIPRGQYRLQVEVC